MQDRTSPMTCVGYVMQSHGTWQTGNPADVSESEFSGTGSRGRLNVSVIAPLPPSPTVRPVRLTRSRCSTSATTRASALDSAGVLPYDDGFGGPQYMRVGSAVDSLLSSSETTPSFARFTPDFDEIDRGGVKLSGSCAAKQHSRQSSFSQASDISSCFGLSPLTPEPCLSSSWSNSGVQGISASHSHISHIAIKSPLSPFQGELSHFLDTSLSCAGAGGGIMAVPSASTVDLQRAKMRKFDIKISQFSVDGSPLPPSTRRTRDSTNSSSRSGGGMEDSRASDGGPVRTQKKSSRGRERVRIELAPDQPPTTQGKQRERVYVACLQW